MFFAKKKEEKEVDLVAMAAHQLRRPLSSTRLSLEMLMKGDFGPLQPEQKDIIEKILKQNATLMCLINDLLQMAQAEASPKNQTGEYVDVMSIINAALTLNYEEINRKKISVDFNRPQVLPRLRLKKEAVAIIFNNLIDNAVKYTLPGGWVKISTALNAKNIEVKIQDSGIGIPDEDHQKIFGRFFRARNANTAAPGSGLGLFITKNIVESGGGKISFDSKEGSGSTFSVTLPAR